MIRYCAHGQAHYTTHGRADPALPPMLPPEAIKNSSICSMHRYHLCHNYRPLGLQAALPRMQAPSSAEPATRANVCKPTFRSVIRSTPARLIVVPSPKRDHRSRRGRPALHLQYFSKPNLCQHLYISLCQTLNLKVSPSYRRQYRFTASSKPPTSANTKTLSPSTLDLSQSLLSPPWRQPHEKHRTKNLLPAHPPVALRFSTSPRLQHPTSPALNPSGQLQPRL